MFFKKIQPGVSLKDWFEGRSVGLAVGIFEGLFVGCRVTGALVCLVVQESPSHSHELSLLHFFCDGRASHESSITDETGLGVGFSVLAFTGLLLGLAVGGGALNLYNLEPE